MKRGIAIGILVYFSCVVETSGQVVYHGILNLYSDSTYTSSEYVDTTAAIVNVYVVCKPYFPLEYAETSRFMIIQSTGFTGVWLGDTCPFVSAYGSTPVGFEVWYGTSLKMPIHVVTATYSFFGTSSPGSYLEVVPHPEDPTGLISYFPCGTCMLAFLEGGRLTISSVSVPANELSWGRIKALYNRR